MEEPQVPLQVSALIVSYNCAGALRRCLRALELSTEREKMEIVAVDNGSLDESGALDPEFPGVTFLRLPRNFGFVKALNIAMRTAKGEFFFFLDPQVEVLPETISSLSARLSSLPDAVAVCPLLVTPEGRAASEVYRLPRSENISAIWRAGAFTGSAPADLERESVPVELHSLAAFMARGYFLKGLRYIDEHYAQSWADAELCAQIRRASKKVLLFPSIRAVRYEDDGLAQSMPPPARALLSADWVLGAATYAGKHFGFLSGLKIRILGVLLALGQALGALLRVRDVHYYFARFLYLLSGQKIDGTQRVM